MRYAIITVGSELTLGLSVNTNAPSIARHLGREGFYCVDQISVPDDIAQITHTISDSLSRFDGIIVTGGLGPTLDDITREAICEALDLRLEYQAEIAELIKERFSAKYIPLPDMIFRQAYLPTGATPILPRLGSAPGIMLNFEGRFLVAMPGVPREMQDMLVNDVTPWLKTSFKSQEFYKLRVIKTSVRTESALQESIDDIINNFSDITVGIIASPGEIQLQLLARAESEQAASASVNNAERLLRERLGNKIFGTDEQLLEEIVGDLLSKHGLTLSFAESCTGGLASKLITDIPGSSKYFSGGVIAYSNEVKHSVLGISNRILEEYGAVSEPTARAMAFGVREKLNADIGVGITGIAGPDGGSAEKPVGLVYVGLSNGSSSLCCRYVFYGSREIVRKKSAYAALDMVRRFLLDNCAITEENK
jgi:nicotinamide-nucleotide amidase